MSETIAQLTQDLIEAQQRYENAKQQSSFARNTECAALNELNNAQKKLSASIADFAKNAPRESDWGRETHNGN